MGNDAFLDVDENDGNEVRLTKGGVEYIGPNFVKHRVAIEAENARRLLAGLGPMNRDETFACVRAAGL